MLSNNPLRRHGIEAIKRRNSRTEGRAYLSDGGLHCDALQSRSCDHDVRHDAETVLSVEVFFDPAWAGQPPEARDAIECWWFDEAVGRAVASGTEPTPAARIGDRLRAWRRSR